MYKKLILLPISILPLLMNANAHADLLSSKLQAVTGSILGYIKYQGTPDGSYPPYINIQDIVYAAGSSIPAPCSDIRVVEEDPGSQSIYISSRPLTTDFLDTISIAYLGHSPVTCLSLGFKKNNLMYTSGFIQFGWNGSAYTAMTPTVAVVQFP